MEKASLTLHTRDMQAEPRSLDREALQGSRGPASQNGTRHVSLGG